VQLKGGQQLKEAQAKKIVKQLLQQLVVMHERNITHRDIKPENVVFTDTTCTHAKFIDFADAAGVENDAIYRELIGTPCYLAPERWNIHRGWELKASDVWAIGIDNVPPFFFFFENTGVNYFFLFVCFVDVLTFEMVTGKRCFNGDSIEQIRNIVISGAWQYPMHQKPSALCAHFVESLLTLDASRRPSARLALFHPWLCEESNDCSTIENALFVEKLIRKWNRLTIDEIPNWACYEGGKKEKHGQYGIGEKGEGGRKKKKAKRGEGGMEN
ncbi:hypothetical protein RFI_23578, partial [Reticulomyxa filosa]